MRSPLVVGQVCSDAFGLIGFGRPYANRIGGSTRLGTTILEANGHLVRRRGQLTDAPSTGSIEIRVTPFLAVVPGERSLDCVVLGAAPSGANRDAFDMLDPTLDVVALWSFRDHREESAKTHIPAAAALDVNQTAIADGAATMGGDGEPLELSGIRVLERLRQRLRQRCLLDLRKGAHLV